MFGIANDFFNLLRRNTVELSLAERMVEQAATERNRVITLKAFLIWRIFGAGLTCYHKVQPSGIRTGAFGGNDFNGLA